MKEYWEKLRELREDRDLTQREIAKLLNTTQQVYSRYEKGVNEMPIRHLKTLCLYYQVSVDEVLSLSIKKHQTIKSGSQYYRLSSICVRSPIVRAEAFITQ